MSDTKRILVWLFVLVWCVLSLCVDVRAQELAPIPEFTEQQCSEPVDVAANTVVIKKKALGSVPAGGGGGSCAASPAVSMTTQNDYYSVGDIAIEGARGQSGWAPASNQTICRIDFYIRAVDAATNWHAGVYEMNGTSLGTLVDLSDAQGLTGGAGAWTSFSTGLSAAVSSAKTYGLVLHKTDHIYNDGADMYINTADQGLSGHHAQWWGDTDWPDVSDDAFVGDVCIKIYYLE